jgi:hypothetical protein
MLLKNHQVRNAKQAAQVQIFIRMHILQIHHCIRRFAAEATAASLDINKHAQAGGGGGGGGALLELVLVQHQY